MISELNGQENYFTRICAGGLLNTRKLELAHMLLQDINMFHLHPHSMPISNSDNNRLISSTISNMTLNDKKMMKKLKAQSGVYGSEMAQIGGSPRLVVNLIKSSSNLLLDSKSNPHSPLMQTKINTSKTETNVNRITTTTTSNPNSSSSSTHYYYNHSQHQQDIAASNSEIKEAIESSIDDLASFTLYSSRKPLNVYQPIKDQFWVFN
jgi:hypothetical protein